MIIVYSRENCAPCQNVKYFLDRNEAEYEVRDVDNPEYTDEWAEYGWTVPIIVKGDQVVIGGNLSAIRTML